MVGAAFLILLFCLFAYKLWGRIDVNECVLQHIGKAHTETAAKLVLAACKNEAHRI